MKWFWLYLFLFLSVLILALGAWRPAALETAVQFLGWWAMALLGVVLVGIVGGLALVGWMYWRKGQLVSLRQRDGAYPLQRVRMRGGAVLYYDPNQAVGLATIVHPQHGLIEIEPSAGWERQTLVRLAVERTKQLQAMYPGDDARMNRHGATSDVPKLPSWKVLDAKPDRKLLPEPMPAAIEAPMLEAEPVRQYSVGDAMMQSARTKLVMGQTADGAIERWDISESPHIRVHGKSQGAGKTNLIRCIAASALRVGHHVVVCDRRRFKDWSEFQGKAELIDVKDPRRFVEVAQTLAAIYQERDAELGRHGAANISRLPNPPQRIVVVIAEFGALCAQAAADGVLEDVLHPLTMVLREAGAAGVHVVIEDQVVDQRWPRGISTNAEPVTGYLPMNYGAAGGYYDAHKLPAYTFHHAGTVFRSLDMRTELPALIRNVGSGAAVVGQFMGSSWNGSQAVHEPVHRQFMGSSPEVDSPSVNGAPVTLDGWYEWTLTEYLPAHLELLTVDARGNGVGVKALAQAMAEHGRGDVGQYEAMKGTASEVAKRLRAEMRLPGGERIGVDVSQQGA